MKAIFTIEHIIKLLELNNTVKLNSGDIKTEKGWTIDDSTRFGEKYPYISLLGKNGYTYIFFKTKELYDNYILNKMKAN